MATVMQRQTEEIRDSLVVVYASDALIVRTFSLPATVEEQIAKIIERRRMEKAARRENESWRRGLGRAVKRLTQEE